MRHLTFVLLSIGSTAHAQELDARQKQQLVQMSMPLALGMAQILEGNRRCPLLNAVQLEAVQASFDEAMGRLFYGGADRAMVRSKLGEVHTEISTKPCTELAPHQQAMAASVGNLTSEWVLTSHVFAFRQQPGNFSKPYALPDPGGDGPYSEAHASLSRIQGYDEEALRTVLWQRVQHANGTDGVGPAAVGLQKVSAVAANAAAPRVQHALEVLLASAEGVTIRPSHDTGWWAYGRSGSESAPWKASQGLHCEEAPCGVFLVVSAENEILAVSRQTGVRSGVFSASSIEPATSVTLTLPSSERGLYRYTDRVYETLDEQRVESAYDETVDGAPARKELVLKSKPGPLPGPMEGFTAADLQAFEFPKATLEKVRKLPEGSVLKVSWTTASGKHPERYFPVDGLEDALEYSAILEGLPGPAGR